MDLDSIISATENPVVLVNNDLSSINVEAALMDEKELGKLTAEQRAKLLERQRETMVKLAIQRANYDTTDGIVRTFSVGGNWAGLGTVVNRALNSAEAIVLADLNYPIEKVPMTYTWNGQTFASDDTFAVIRGDNGAKLGSVGSRYEVFQNAQTFEFLDSVLGEYGAKYETAGSLDGGKKVWIMAHFPKQAFSVVTGDEVQPFVTVMNYHDGSGCANVFANTVRVECDNTLRRAMDKRGARSLSIRHTGDLKAKIRDAQKALGLAVQSFGQFKDDAAVMARTTLNVHPYLSNLLDQVLDVTESQVQQGADFLAQVVARTTDEVEAARKHWQRLINRRERIKEDILTRYETQKNGIGGIRGTAWSAFNAVTEYADHSPLNRYQGDDRTRAERRFESILNGKADEVKQLAFVQAMAAAR